MTAPDPTKATTVLLYNAVHSAGFWDRFEAELRRRGYDVQSYGAMSACSYRRAKNWLQRAHARLLINIWFPFTSIVRAAIRRRGIGSTVHIVTTNPFFLPPMIALVARIRAEQAVFLVFDLYPDAFIAAGWTGPKIFYRVISTLTRRGFRWASATVFLGRELQRYSEQQYGRPRQSRVIPVGSDGEFFRQYPPSPRATSERITITYAGTLGRMHDAETLERLLQQPLPAHIRLQFFASGTAYARLRQRATNSNAELHGSLNEDAWRECLIHSDISLVTIGSGAERVIMPSKTYSSLAAGLALLAVCSETSDLAHLIREHDCGWIVPPGDTERLRSTLIAITRDRTALYIKRRNAFIAGHAFYDMPVVVSQWDNLINELNHKRLEMGNSA